MSPTPCHIEIREKAIPSRLSGENNFSQFTQHPLFTQSAESYYGTKPNIEDNYPLPMKKKHIVAIILGFLTLIGVLFHDSITEYTKHKLNGPTPTTEVEKPAPKKVSYTVKFTREVE